MKQSDRTPFLAFAMGLMSGSMLAEPIYQGVFANAGTVEILEDDEFFSGSLGKSLGGVFEGEDGTVVYSGFWASQTGSIPEPELILDPGSIVLDIEYQGGEAVRGKVRIKGSFDPDDNYEAYIAFVIPSESGMNQGGRGWSTPLNVSIDDAAIWTKIEPNLLISQGAVSMELNLNGVFDSFPEVKIALGNADSNLEYQIFLRIHKVF